MKGGDTSGEGKKYRSDIQKTSGRHGLAWKIAVEMGNGAEDIALTELANCSVFDCTQVSEEKYTNGVRGVVA